MPFRHALLATLLVAASWSAALAQTETVDDKKRRDAVEKNSETFRFGLSLGWRHIKAAKSDLLQDVAIDPATSKVAVERIDRGAVVLSGVVVAFPWENEELQRKRGEVAPCPAERGISCRLGSAASAWRWGFIANINVASFTQDNIAVFNKSVEGGLGLAYKMNEEFALATTVERVFGRSLRSFVRPDSVLKAMDGTVVKTLSSSDNTYFRDNNLTAWSIKFAYFFK